MRELIDLSAVPRQNRMLRLWEVATTLGIVLPLLFLVLLVPAAFVSRVGPWTLFLMFVGWTAFVGFTVLWSGHRYANPVGWLRPERLGWNHDPEAESWDVQRSRMWRRRAGILLIIVSPVLGGLAAVAYSVSA